MSNAGMGLFFLFGLVALLSALGTIALHSPIRAAMALLAHIISLSGLFLLLHAHVLAALQVLVYAGAVVVLFVFVIMMIGPSVPEPLVLRGMLVKTMSVAVMLLVTAFLAFSLMPISMPHLSLALCTDAEGAECEQFGGVIAFSKSLYGGAFVPFELISVLLTVAIVGAIAVGRGRTAAEHLALANKLKKHDGKEEAPVVPAAAALPVPAASASGSLKEARELTRVADATVRGGH
jgi:NADH-quinone oxidoreductase subunit J